MLSSACWHQSKGTLQCNRDVDNGLLMLQLCNLKCNDYNAVCFCDNRPLACTGAPVQRAFSSSV